MGKRLDSIRQRRSDKDGGKEKAIRYFGGQAGGEDERKKTQTAKTGGKQNGRTNRHVRKEERRLTGT